MAEKKVLIIDDTEIIRAMLQDLLKEQGYQVLTASTGEEGIDRAKEYRPDIILIDTKMPGIDGFETCRRIKQVEGMESKVVVMTADIDAVDTVKARQMGADDYCAKTRDFVPLLETVKNLF